VRINEELMEIWLNKVCDNNNEQSKMNIEIGEDKNNRMELTQCMGVHASEKTYMKQCSSHRSFQVGLKTSKISLFQGF